MDKENRILLEICPHIDLPRISTGSGAPSEEDPQLEEIQLLGYDLFYGCDSKDWPVISDYLSKWIEYVNTAAFMESNRRRRAF